MKKNDNKDRFNRQYNEVWSGTRNYERIEFVVLLSNKQRQILYLIYKLEVATVSQLSFMTDYGYQNIIDNITNLKNTAKKKNKSKDSFIISYKEGYLGRSRTFYQLTKAGYEYITRLIQEDDETYNLYLKTKSLYIHTSESGYLFSRLFKNAHDISMEKEIEISSNLEKNLIRADSRIKVFYNETMNNEFLIEHETGSKRPRKFTKKLFSYTEIMNIQVDNILVITVCRGKDLSGVEVRQYDNDNEHQMLKELIRIFKHINKEYKTYKDMETQELLKDYIHFKKSGYKIIPYREHQILIEKDLLELRDFLEYAIDHIEEWEYIIPDGATVQETGRYLKSYKYSYLDCKMVESVYDLDMYHSNAIRELILNSEDYNYIEQADYYEIAEDIRNLHYEVFEVNNQKLYRSKSFKSLMSKHEIIISPLHDVGDIMYKMTSSMIEIEKFFNTVFYPGENIVNFKYEPLSFRKDGIEYRKSLYSATGEVNDKKVGMVFFIPAISLSDEYKIKALGEAKGPITIKGYDDIKYLILELSDLLDCSIGRNGKIHVERDYFSDYVFDEEIGMSKEIADLSWISNKMINDVKSFTHNKILL